MKPTMILSDLSVAAAQSAALEVLLVEDSPADALLVSEMLALSGGASFSIQRCERLAAARDYLLSTPVACVLLDLSLPDATGLEAVRQVRTVAPDVPVVVLSGLTDERIAVQAVQEGAQDYLIKGSADGDLITRAIRYAIERKRVELELAHQALHDPLTDLPNRALFLDRLSVALARTARHDRSVAVLFLDLDRFKVVNDSLGHEAGDDLLVAVGERLRGLMRPSDTIARFGGDEFTILCEEIESERDAVLVAERIAADLRRPFPLPHDGEAHLTASVGIAIATGGDGSRPRR